MRQTDFASLRYLMSGGDNSLHVVMGFRKPDARGEIALRPKPYSGKFFMSGAAAGRVFVFDPGVKLDPEQYRGNVLSAITPEEWSRVDYRVADPPQFTNWLGLAVNLLPLIFFGAILLFMMRQAQGSNNQAISFG